MRTRRKVGGAPVRGSYKEFLYRVNVLEHRRCALETPLDKTLDSTTTGTLNAQGCTPSFSVFLALSLSTSVPVSASCFSL